MVARPVPGTNDDYTRGLLDDIDGLNNVWVAPTLQNSWANLGSGWVAAGYIKQNGWVHLRGLVAGGALNAAIFTLPAGFRPASHHAFAALVADVTSGAQSAGTAHTHALGPRGANLQVLTTGVVQLADALASNVFVSLCGIKFRTD